MASDKADPVYFLVQLAGHISIACGFWFTLLVITPAWFTLFWVNLFTFVWFFGWLFYFAKE